MDGWIWQGGYPIVTASASEGTTRLSQRRFLLGGGESDATWDVPMVVRRGGSRSSVLIEAGGADLDTQEGDLLVVNADAYAFARVRYEGARLERIAASLGELSTDERTQLVDDAWAAVVAGHADAGEWFRFAASFADETELPVWQALIQGFGWADRLLDRAPREHLRAWVRALLSPALERIGWEPRDGERDLDRSLRGTLLSAVAILGAEPNAHALAREIEKEARAGEPADPSLASAAVGIVAAGGGVEEYETFLGARKTAPTPQEQLRYLYALSDFRDPVLLERTISMTLTDEVRPQNVPGVVARSLANRDHGDVAWRFLTEHWDEVVGRVAPSTVVYLVMGARYLTAPELVEETDAFFAEHPIPQAALQLRQTLESQKVFADLRRRAVPQLQTFFSAPR
jgi:aminopeptidase N